MGKLTEQMLMDMALLNLSPRTIKCYGWHLKKFSEYFHEDLEKLDENDIRKYLYYLKTEKQYSSTNVCQAYSAIKFLYRNVMKMPFALSTLRGPKRVKKLPTVLSREEIKRIFNVVDNLKYRVILKTVYSGGLRISEATHLRLSDIDSKRMVLRVEQGKGKKDRYTLLSKALLPELREYWRVYRPQYWLFPGKDKREPLNSGSVMKEFAKARKAAKILKPATLHTLRHSFATHLLEQGVGLFTIQKLLGHAHIQTTMIYLHIQKHQGLAIINPLDNLEAEI